MSRPRHLHVETVVHDWGTELILAGVIDDIARESLGDCLAALAPHGRVRFTFRGIKQVTSAGVGYLMRIFSELKRGHDVEFAECSGPVVNQFQMMEFSRYGRMISFYAWFRCDRCAAESSRLLAVTELSISSDGVRAPESRCPCGGTMAVDEFLDFIRDDQA